MTKHNHDGEKKNLGLTELNFCNLLRKQQIFWQTINRETKKLRATEIMSNAEKSAKHSVPT